MILKSVSFLLIMINFSVYCQFKSNISGKITLENKNISDIIIELKINQTSKCSISNNKGVYQFNNIPINTNDSIYLKVKYFGAKPFSQSLNNLKENNLFDINLSNIEPENLNEVVVKGKENFIISSKKHLIKLTKKIL